MDVVSLCDVDRHMLTEAAEIVATRQVSKKKPRTYTDYREMLRERDLDLVLIDTPDHWHALPMIEAVRSGLDVWVQKPISVDIVEGQAMLAAARKYKRVVQVGTQRRSTPHLVDARDRIIREGKLGTVGHVEIYCYYHMRATANPPDTPPPEYLDYEMWTGPAPMRPYNSLVHPRSWRAFMEYGNGIVGDMCVHMLDMVRWMLDLGMPTRGQLVGRHSGRQGEQGEHHRHPDGHLRLRRSARSCGTTAPGAIRPIRSTRGARRSTATRGTLKASVMSYDFIPIGQGRHARPRGRAVRVRQYPEDKTEKDLETHVAPAIRGHMKNFLECIAVARAARVATSSRATSRRPPASWRTVAAAGPLADVGSRGKGRGRRRRRGQRAAAAAVPAAVGASGSGDGLGVCST